MGCVWTSERWAQAFQLEGGRLTKGPRLELLLANSIGLQSFNKHFLSASLALDSVLDAEQTVGSKTSKAPTSETRKQENAMTGWRQGKVVASGQVRPSPASQV